MGGYQGGKDASNLAMNVVKEISGKLASEKDLKECIERVSLAIKNEAKKLGYEGMGTTIAIAKVIPENKNILTANVGDSPIFLIHRSKPITVLYHDDSVRSIEPLNLWSITQYVGYDQNLSIHTHASTYEKGDILLLCSDGISDNIQTDSIEHIVRGTNIAKELVELSVRNSLKQDDMTALVVSLT